MEASPQNNVMPLRGGPTPPTRTPPVNYDAEQALLGAVLANNLVYDRVNEFLRPEHFADALHGRIFAAIGKLIERGQIANPVTLKNLFDQDGALSEIGGAAYLVSRAIREAKVVGFEDLGMEAIYEFTVEDMPVTVAVDSEGNNVHTIAPAHWKDKIAKEKLLAG